MLLKKAEKLGFSNLLGGLIEEIVQGSEAAAMDLSACCASRAAGLVV